MHTKEKTDKSFLWVLADSFSRNLHVLRPGCNQGGRDQITLFSASLQQGLPVDYCILGVFGPYLIKIKAKLKSNDLVQLLSFPHCSWLRI